jgi:hypothetical protein
VSRSIRGSASPPPFYFSVLVQESTQGSYFEAISGVFPYPNGSCNKIGFHIFLQIDVIGMAPTSSLSPPKNRTCEFPRIRLKRELGFSCSQASRLLLLAGLIPVTRARSKSAPAKISCLIPRYLSPIHPRSYY